MAAGGGYDEQEYYDEGAEQYDEGGEYYDDEAYDEESSGDSGVDYNEADVVRSLPWMAIAVALHAIVLLITVFIITLGPTNPDVEVLRTDLDDNPILPLPEEEEPPEVEMPKDEEPIEDPTEDERITEEAVDETNEDPSEQPFNERAENPNADDSEAESPNPNSGPASAFGLAGGGGGGGGGGGRGGAALRRARGGGGKKNQKRVEAGLQWLADHQNFDGHWSSTNYMDDSIRLKKGAESTGIIEFERIGEPGIGWENTVDVGITGLSLLAFVGDGHTHREGKFRDAVRRGLKWIRNVQDPDGLYGVKDGDEFVYNHAICAMAIIEIYMISADRKLKSQAQRAVDFIVKAQNANMGWRYDVKPGVNDSSVTAWMVLALKSAKMAELSFPIEEVYKGANNWYDKVTTDEDGYLMTGYDQPGVGCARLATAEDFEETPSMDACCVMVRLFTHHAKPSDRVVKAQCNRMVQSSSPTWDHYKLDFYYWYYASLALFQMSGKLWSTWEKAIINPVLLAHQRGWHALDIEKFGKRVSVVSDGEDSGRWILDEHGSWDPVDCWGAAGGRVYSTAINTLTLEVYYRYLLEYN